MKRCGSCREYLPLADFYRSARDGWQSQCKGCKRAYNAANRAATASRHREYLKRWTPTPQTKAKIQASSARSARMIRYGITDQQFDAMMAEQGGVCAICGRPETATHRISGQVQSLAVDHDHETGVVRGLLCKACNIGLGWFADNPAYLSAAANYLCASMDGCYADEAVGE